MCSIFDATPEITCRSFFPCEFFNDKNPFRQNQLISRLCSSLGHCTTSLKIALLTQLIAYERLTCSKSMYILAFLNLVGETLQHTALNYGSLQRRNCGNQYLIHIELYDRSGLLEIVLENWTCQVH